MATWSVAGNPVTAQQKAKLRGVRGCRAERLAGWLTLFQQRIASCQSWRCHLDRNPVPDTTPITNLSVTQGHTHLCIHMFSIKKKPYQWKHMYSDGAMGGREKIRKNGEKEYILSFINTNTRHFRPAHRSNWSDGGTIWFQLTTFIHQFWVGQVGL